MALITFNPQTLNTWVNDETKLNAQNMNKLKDAIVYINDSILDKNGRGIVTELNDLHDAIWGIKDSTGKDLNYGVYLYLQTLFSDVYGPNVEYDKTNPEYFLVDSCGSYITGGHIPLDSVTLNEEANHVNAKVGETEYVSQFDLSPENVNYYGIVQAAYNTQRYAEYTRMRLYAHENQYGPNFIKFADGVTEFSTRSDDKARLTSSKIIELISSNKIYLDSQEMQLSANTITMNRSGGIRKVDIDSDLISLNYFNVDGTAIYPDTNTQSLGKEDKPFSYIYSKNATFETCKSETFISEDATFKMCTVSETLTGKDANFKALTSIDAAFGICTVSGTLTSKDAIFTTCESGIFTGGDAIFTRCTTETLASKNATFETCEIVDNFVAKTGSITEDFTVKGNCIVKNNLSSKTATIESCSIGTLAVTSVSGFNLSGNIVPKQVPSTTNPSLGEEDNRFNEIYTTDIDVSDTTKTVNLEVTRNANVANSSVTRATITNADIQTADVKNLATHTLRIVESGTLEGAQKTENNSLVKYQTIKGLVKRIEDLEDSPSGLSVDEKQFEIKSNNVLSIKSYDTAEAGTYLVKSNEGVTWVKPDTTTVEGMSQSIAALEARVTEIEKGNIVIDDGSIDPEPNPVA